MTDPRLWWYLARAGGLVAWALLSSTVVWGLLLRSGLLGRWVPWEWTATVHRFLGMLSVLFVGLHLTGLLLDTTVHFGLGDLLVPLASDWRPVPVALGVTAGYLLLAVVGTSVLTPWLPRRWWKRVHLTSYLLFWSATVHLLTAGTDAAGRGVRTAVAGVVLAVLGLTAARIVPAFRAGRPPAAAGPRAPASVFHRLRVAEVLRETPDAVSVRLAVPRELAGKFRFAPGQHVVVRGRPSGAVLSRAYSICSGVTEGQLRIAVRQVPGGRMSTWLNTVVRVGDVLEVAPPAGRFAADLDPGASRHVLGIAAGSGITPVISIVSSVLAAEPASRCTLLYGNRTGASTMFAGRIAGLQERYPDRLRVVHLRSRERAAPPVLSGRIDADALTALALRGDLAAVDEAYVCGPGAMTAEVARSLVEDLGMAAERVHTVVFSAAPPEPPADGRPCGTVRIRFGGRDHAVPVAVGESVLDAGLRAGVQLPYSCRVGACGSCSAVVGAQGSSEVAATCQLRSGVGGTVDFDAVGAAASRHGGPGRYPRRRFAGAAVPGGPAAL